VKPARPGHRKRLVYTEFLNVSLHPHRSHHARNVWHHGRRRPDRAFYVIQADLRRRGLAADPNVIVGLTGLAGLAGARLYHLAESPSEFFCGFPSLTIQHYGVRVVRPR